MFPLIDARARRSFVLVPMLTLLACDPAPSPSAPPAERDEAPSSDAVAEHLSAATGVTPGWSSLQTLAYHTEGFTDPPNEAFVPGDTAPSFPRTQFQIDVTHDIAGDRLRLDRQGTTPGPGFIVDQIERIDGDVGVAEGLSAVGPLGPMPSDRVAALRRNQRLLNPALLLAETFEDPSLVIGADFEFDGQSLLLVLEVDDAVAPITVEVVVAGPAGPSVQRVLTEENDLLLRDTEVEVSFGDWQWVAGGWRMPHYVEVRQDGHLVQQEERSGYVVNGPIDDEALELPAGPPPPFDATLASLGERSAQAQLAFPPGIQFPDGRPSQVVPVELFPGVYFLTGTLHNSMLVEQADRLVLLEAPAFPERSEAISAWVEATFPTKAITHVVATHHHSDHTAGLRTFVAQGAAVVVGEATESFFADDVFARSSAIVPDALSLAPVEDPEVIGVPADQTFTLEDPLHPVVVVPVPSVHAADMVAAYLPQEQVVFNSDLYSPGFPASFEALLVGAIELNQAIESNQLAVSWMAAGHGAVVPSYADFLAEFGL